MTKGNEGHKGRKEWDDGQERRKTMKGKDGERRKEKQQTKALRRNVVVLFLDGGRPAGILRDRNQSTNNTRLSPKSRLPKQTLGEWGVLVCHGKDLAAEFLPNSNHHRSNR